MLPVWLYCHSSVSLQVRSHSSVRSVGRVSPVGPIWSGTGARTLGKSRTLAKSAASDSAFPTCLRHTERSASGSPARWPFSLPAWHFPFTLLATPLLQATPLPQPSPPSRRPWAPWWSVPPRWGLCHNDQSPRTASLICTCRPCPHNITPPTLTLLSITQDTPLWRAIPLSQSQCSLLSCLLPLPYLRASQ